MSTIRNANSNKTLNIGKQRNIQNCSYDYYLSYELNDLKQHKNWIKLMNYKIDIIIIPFLYCNTEKNGTPKRILLTQ